MSDRFTDHKKIALRVLEDYEESLTDHASVFSTNNKCRFSIDLPICLTCRPTSVCRALCYGFGPGHPQGQNIDVLRKQARVLNFLRFTSPEAAAARIYHECKRKHMNFLRWCGVGDLIPEAVVVINTLSRLHPELTQWIVTRKPELAAHVTRAAPNLYLMFSLDASSADSRQRMHQMARHQHPRLYYSYLRQHPGEVPILPARIIYDYKKHSDGAVRSKFVCPADMGIYKNKKRACARCRMCFSPAVLDGNRYSSQGTNRGMTR